MLATELKEACARLPPDVDRYDLNYATVKLMSSSWQRLAVEASRLTGPVHYNIRSHATAELVPVIDELAGFLAVVERKSTECVPTEFLEYWLWFTRLHWLP